MTLAILDFKYAILNRIQDTEARGDAQSRLNCLLHSALVYFRRDNGAFGLLETMELTSSIVKLEIRTARSRLERIEDTH